MSRPTSHLTPRALLLAAACALLAGCVQMPTSGPVEVPQVTSGTEAPPGISFDPRPPQAGESAAEIVAGFLEAMKATPIRTTVARQFLSREAADAWAPEQQVVTYGELGAVAGEMTVQVPLTDVNLYDARGAWQVTRAKGELDLGLVEEDGEWRIDEVPNALIVPDTWFDEWYQRVSLYYFDPTAEVLVPEPVYVPRGDPFASSLVRSLLTPLPPDAQDVSRTYFPPVTTNGLSVPIDSGVARVALPGDPDSVDDDTARRMLAQLVWTLRQDDTIKAVEFSIGGRVLALGPGGSTQVNLNVGAAYDPTGDQASPALFALARGRVVTGTIDAFQETVGPLGQGAYAVRSIGVNIAGSRVAAVSADGSGLYVAPTEAADSDVAEPVIDAVDLAEPAWDYRDRIWVLDRGAGRARVIVVVDGNASALDVPGLTGENVTQLLVSRDGSRLVAVVRGRKADHVVVGRVRHDQQGVVVGFTPFRTLPLSTDGSTRVRDIGWRSPTTVSVLRDNTDDISEVRTLWVDGAPGEITTGGTTRLRGPARLLVSGPVDGSDAYARLAGQAVVNLTHPERVVPDLPKGLTSLGYVG